MNLKKIGLALAVSAAATSANAAWETGENGVGELVLSVWNTVSGQSFTQDLGVLVDDTSIMDNSSFSLNLDIDGLNHVGGASAAGDLMWNVGGFANDLASVQATGDFADLSIYLTQVADPGAPTHAFATLATVGNPRFVDYNTVLQNNGTQVGTAANPVYLLDSSEELTAASENVWGTSVRGLDFTSLSSELTATANGDSLYAYSFRLNQTGGGDIVQSQGQWTLDAASGLLNYGSVAAVPVPAAVWMFASGLMGLAGVARRNKKAQA